MYRSCIFCSAPLGSNESIERFPVGRSLAFDGEKGRLWAVCPRCARWNLAPLEERWEAMEEAERLFRDTRLRVQRENISLAKLPDGTRLVRVGQALAGELAAWRYGETLFRRRRRHLLAGGAVAAVGAAMFVAGIAGAGFGAASVYYIPGIVRRAWYKAQGARVVQRLPPAAGGEPVTVRRRDLSGAKLVQADGVLGIHFPRLLDEGKEHRPFVGGEAVYTRTRALPLVVAGDAARTLLARSMVHVNAQGARRGGVEAALQRISIAGSPDAFLLDAARRQRVLVPLDREAAEPVGNLALEMALHEETERRALDGELAMLEGMWRQAEEIAAIADRLPEIPAAEPPRIAGEG
ncbi:MAG TPA: hypothetical protein VFT45_26335 [Longimicrobium sp.]|nr:hypothetical protein [Longimicrobium sp.]